jgi:hypothetical protein
MHMIMTIVYDYITLYSMYNGVGAPTGFDLQRFTKTKVYKYQITNITVCIRVQYMNYIAVPQSYKAIRKRVRFHFLDLF